MNVAIEGDIQTALMDACADAGIEYKHVPADGKWHRADLANDRDGKADASIMLFADGMGGIVMNWKDGEPRAFFADDGRNLPAVDRELRKRRTAEARAKADEERAARARHAATTTIAVWNKATPARDDHPYLVRKGVAPTAGLREMDAEKVGALINYAPESDGVKLAGRILIAPVRRRDTFSTFEMIDEHGRKSALAGGTKSGGYWATGRIADGAAIYVCEGVATGISLSECADGVAVSALSCSNLPKVAAQMRERYPTSRIIVCGDIGNGAAKAREAAEMIGAAVAFPEFGPNRPDGATDFNDLHVFAGAEAVRACIAAAVIAPVMSQTWPQPLPLTADTPPLEYPVESLPPCIRAAVEEVCGFVQAPVPLVASSAIAALSLAIQATVDIKRAERLTGPVGLFMLTIADSGERKSTCDGFFTKAIRDYESEQAEVFKPVRKDHQADLSAWEAKYNGLKEKIKADAKARKSTIALEADLRDLEHEKPEPPRVPRLIYADVTPEALAFALATQWPSGGVVSAEAGIVFGSHGMGSDSVMRNLATLNQLWDGSTLQIDRRTSESFAVRGARLTVALQVQDATIRSFFERSGTLARGTGFLARFLIAWPESTQGYRPFREAPEHWPNMATFNQRLTQILHEPPPLDDNGHLAPLMLTLSPEAKVAWVGFHDAIEAQLRSGADLHEVRDVASKSADNAARLAALFHVFSGASGPVALDSFESAASIVAWHLSESKRFFGELALPDSQADAARLDAWLLERCRNEGAQIVSKRIAQQFGPLRKAEPLSAALKTLEDMDRVRVERVGKQTVIHINPALLTPGGAK